MKFKVTLYLILLGFLCGCQNKKPDDEKIYPVHLLYDNGKSYLAEGNYKKASEEFEKIYYQHPGSYVTPYAELMEAYSLFLSGRYEDVIDVLNIFIQIHPAHQDIAYAYYLRGLSEYMRISRSELDQSITVKAQDAFNQLIALFPHTKYATDAKLKMDLIQDHLAGNEMYIGRYYLKIHNPIAAMSRFKNVIDHYDSTSHTAEALYRMTEIFVMLDLKEEAIKYAAVLGHNYNNSKWYKRAYQLVK